MTKTLSNQLRAVNPYPIDIFTEPTKKDWEWLNSICRINGLNSESFMGSFGRRVWKNCCEELENIQRDQRDSK